MSFDRRRKRPPARRRQDVVRREHQDPRLRLRLRRRDVDGHLVAVEVRVERDTRAGAPGSPALDEHRLERLDAETMARRSGSAAPGAPG